MRSALLFIAVAGAVGGLANALFDQGGLALPETVVVQGSRVLMPGFIGNMVVGAIAAVLSWSLYGPFAERSILSRSDVQAAAPRPVALSLAALAGAVLVGFSGGRWITAEAEKRLDHWDRRPGRPGRGASRASRRPSGCGSLPRTCKRNLRRSPTLGSSRPIRRCRPTNPL